MNDQQQLKQLNQQLLFLVSLCSPIFVLVALVLAQYFSESTPIIPLLDDPDLMKMALVVGVAVSIFEALCIVQNMRKRSVLIQKIKSQSLNEASL